MLATPLAHSVKSVLAVLGLMVLWRVTEAVPLLAVLFPLRQVTGAQPEAPYPFSARNTLLN